MKIIYKLGDRVVSVEEFRDGAPGIELGKPPMAANTYSGADPLVSDGVGCMKSQVGEMREVIRKHGIQGAEVANNGQIHFTSRRARRELLRVRGLVDNDAGYSD